MKNIILPILFLTLFASGLFFLETTITPFFISAILAYIFHPFVQKTSTALSINKNILIALVVLLVTFVIFGIVGIFIPILYKQINVFLLKIPVYIEYIQNVLLPTINNKTQYLDKEFLAKIDELSRNILISISNELSSNFSNIIGYTTSVIEVIIILILVPVILFYFLRDWPKNILSENSELIMGKNIKSILQKILSDIDILLSSYMRGQFNVCAIMAIYYSTSLSLIGLDLAILIGIISGFAIILPFVGFLASFAIAMIIGYFDFGISTSLLYLSLIYIAGSILEGSILTPKVIGHKIGLHPLWIIFSVLALGNIFGIVGMLLAIPIAGIIKILLKSAIALYIKTK